MTVRRATRKRAITAMATIALAGTPMAAGAKDKPAPSRPVPIGNPGSWIAPDSYPDAARNAGLQGRVAYTIHVDKAGMPTNCIVTESSGSDLLDTAACQQMLANARFKPSLDQKGRPVRGEWPSATRWKLDVTPAPAPAVTAKP